MNTTKTTQQKRTNKQITAQITKQWKQTQQQNTPAPPAVHKKEVEDDELGEGPGDMARRTNHGWFVGLVDCLVVAGVKQVRIWEFENLKTNMIIWESRVWGNLRRSCQQQLAAAIAWQVVWDDMRLLVVSLHLIAWHKWKSLSASSFEKASENLRIWKPPW